eukprot:scaffold1170_cov122-Cylindrotheca_fusiformis.AAC.29
MSLEKYFANLARETGVKQFSLIVDHANSQGTSGKQTLMPEGESVAISLDSIPPPPIRQICGEPSIVQSTAAFDKI